jgi:hypothetical protein
VGNGIMPANESFPLPSESEEDIHEIHNRVRNRAERYPTLSAGYIAEFPSVYDCDLLASSVISNASKLCAIAW